MSCRSAFPKRMSVVRWRPASSFVATSRTASSKSEALRRRRCQICFRARYQRASRAECTRSSFVPQGSDGPCNQLRHQRRSGQKRSRLPTHLGHGVAGKQTASSPIAFGQGSAPRRHWTRSDPARVEIGRGRVPPGSPHPKVLPEINPIQSIGQPQIRPNYRASRRFRAARSFRRSALSWMKPCASF